MKTLLLSLSAAVALGLAGCDRGNTETRAVPQGSAATGSSAGTGAGAPTTPQSNHTTTPANLGKPGAGDGSPANQPPVQQREDVRQPEQRRDFEQKGDSAGPKPGG